MYLLGVLKSVGEIRSASHCKTWKFTLLWNEILGSEDKIITLIQLEDC